VRAAALILHVAVAADAGLLVLVRQPVPLRHDGDIRRADLPVALLDQRRRVERVQRASPAAADGSAAAGRTSHICKWVMAAFDRGPLTSQTSPRSSSSAAPTSPSAAATSALSAAATSALSGGSHGVSTGAAAGIGIGVALAAILAFVGVLLLFRRGRSGGAGQGGVLENGEDMSLAPKYVGARYNSTVFSAPVVHPGQSELPLN
jgi:hypothetical protein